MKIVGGQQKFRIPFKNLSDHDLDVEFNFLELSSAVSLPAIKRQNAVAGETSDRLSPIEFSI